MINGRKFCGKVQSRLPIVVFSLYWKFALKILTKEFPFRILKNITFKFLHLKSITNTIISTKNNVHIIKASLSDRSLLKHSCSIYLLCTILENFILRRGNTIIKLWLNDSIIILTSTVLKWQKYFLKKMIDNCVKFKNFHMEIHMFIFKILKSYIQVFNSRIKTL